MMGPGVVPQYAQPQPYYQPQPQYAPQYAPQQAMFGQPAQLGMPHMPGQDGPFMFFTQTPATFLPQGAPAPQGSPVAVQTGSIAIQTSLNPAGMIAAMNSGAYQSTRSVQSVAAGSDGAGEQAGMPLPPTATTAGLSGVYPQQGAPQASIASSHFVPSPVAGQSPYYTSIQSTGSNFVPSPYAAGPSYQAGASVFQPMVSGAQITSAHSMPSPAFQPMSGAQYSPAEYPASVGSFVHFAGMQQAPGAPGQEAPQAAPGVEVTPLPQGIKKAGGKSAAAKKPAGRRCFCC